MFRTQTLIFLVAILLASPVWAQEVQSVEHDTLNGQYNSLLQVDADTYALAYAGEDGDGVIKTFTISAGGMITALGSFEHDTALGQFNSLVAVTADTYALAYVDDGNNGVIKTFTISDDGVTISQLDSFEHDSDFAQQNSLVQVDVDTYALAYTGVDFDGFIKTFTILADGTISEVASLEYDTVQSLDPSLVQVDADTYALTYSGAGGDGFIKTFTISANGATITEEQVLEHDIEVGRYNALVQVDTDTFALAYAGDQNDGFIKTFDISSDGSVITQLQFVEHDLFDGLDNALVQVDADTYALAYRGDGSDGFIKTFSISSDGMTIMEVESREHDTANGTFNSLVQVDADTYALAYTGDEGDGLIKTFTISPTGLLPVTLQSFLIE